MRVSHISTLIIQCTDIPPRYPPDTWGPKLAGMLTITLPHNPVPNESKSSQPVDRLKEDTIFTDI